MGYTDQKRLMGLPDWDWAIEATSNKALVSVGKEKDLYVTGILQVCNWILPNVTSSTRIIDALLSYHRLLTHSLDNNNSWFFPFLRKVILLPAKPEKVRLDS